MTNKKNLWFIILISIIYALLYFLLLPHIVLVRSDDFGYIDSFLKSISANKIVTSDWLEPYNFFSTLLMVLVYFSTQNMYFSTYGIQSILAFVYFVLLLYWITPKVGITKGSLISLIIVTLPLYLNISTDLTGVLATWTLVFAAIITWKKKHINLFYVLVFLAFSNRQSTLFLIVFPIYDLVHVYFKRGKILGLDIMRLCVFFIFASLLHLYMNTTLYRQTGVYQVGLLQPNHLLSTSLPLFIIGISTCIIFFVFVNLLDAPIKIFSYLQNNLKKPFIPILASILITLVLWYMKGVPINLETPYIKGSPLVQPSYMFFLLTSVWFFPWNLLKINTTAIMITFFVFVTSLRGRWWDYYYWDIFVLCLFYYLDTFHREHNIKKVKYDLLIIIFILFVNIVYSYLFKVYLDQEQLKILAYEKLLRNNKIQSTDIYDAPFGYTGWKWFDYFMENYGYRKNASPSYFRCYMTTWGYKLVTELPWKKGFDKQFSQKYELLESNIGVVGFRQVEYRIYFPKKVKTYTSQCLSPYSTMPQEVNNTFASKIFPLNDSEWRDFINSQH